MPFLSDGDSSLFPLVFPILFPIIFPMGFMVLFMLRGGGPMGMMMGGNQRHQSRDERPPSRRSRPERAAPEDSASSESPLEVAQRRYAAGEITRSEFQRIREDLG
jgi:uncharacterized membrane protein